MFLSPEVAIVQHSTGVMQVAFDFFENGITFFTNLVYSSIRFTIGFLGAASASPLVGFLHQATGSLAAPMLVLAGFGAVTFACALLFPNRREELQPELWARAGGDAAAEGAGRLVGAPARPGG